MAMRVRIRQEEGVDGMSRTRYEGGRFRGCSCCGRRKRWVIRAG